MILPYPRKASFSETNHSNCIYFITNHSCLINYYKLICNGKNLDTRETFFCYWTIKKEQHEFVTAIAKLKSNVIRLVPIIKKIKKKHMKIVAETTQGDKVILSKWCSRF